jgi:hypothetical protein
MTLICFTSLSLTSPLLVSTPKCQANNQWPPAADQPPRAVLIMVWILQRAWEPFAVMSLVVLAHTLPPFVAVSEGVSATSE